MFQQIFISLQVKRSVMISYKHCIYELPDELSNDLKPRILGNQEKLGKSQNFIELLPSAQSLPPGNEDPLALAKTRSLLTPPKSQPASKELTMNLPKKFAHYQSS